MNELSLFTGAGGGLLGGYLSDFTTVCAVEIEPYCREILLRRQRDGMLPLFPIWDDVKTFDGRSFHGLVDCVTAGFPCQPFSVAGRREGESDERNLWPETVRILGEVRPRFALLENVPGLLAHPYFRTILGDLAEIGYDVRWDCIPACFCTAQADGTRLWIVAEAHGDNRDRGCGAVQMGRNGNACQAPKDYKRTGIKRGTEPAVGRVAHGVAHRVDRLKALGNGQVPAVARLAWQILNMAK